MGLELRCRGLAAAGGTGRGGLSNTSLDAAEPIVFFSLHSIKEGRLDGFRETYAKGAVAIEREKPDTVTFLTHLDEDRREVNTIHVSPNPAPMGRHFEGVEERAAGAAEYLEFREFSVYGMPSNEAMAVL